MLKRLLDAIQKVSEVGGIIAFIVMAVMGFLQVLTRFVLNTSIYFSEELARGMFVWSVFLISAVCYRMKGHAALSLFVGWMPKRIKKPVLILTELLSVVFFVIVLYTGIQMTIGTYGQVSPALELPMSYFYAAIPIGSLFMLIFSLEQLVGIILNNSQDFASEDEVTEC